MKILSLNNECLPHGSQRGEARQVGNSAAERLDLLPLPLCCARATAARDAITACSDTKGYKTDIRNTRK